MDISVLPLPLPRPIYLSHEPGSDRGDRNAVFVLVDIYLRLINHNTERKERILGCGISVHGKRQRLVEDVPAQMFDAEGNNRVHEILLDPLDSPRTNRVVASIPAWMLSYMDTMTLYLNFEMVGPIRNIKKKLTTVQYFHMNPRHSYSDTRMDTNRDVTNT